MNFGIKFLGNHAIIKINAKLTQEERRRLARLYVQLNISEIGGNLTRIEGCMHRDTYLNSFRFDYKMAIKRSKIAYMQEHIKDMEKEKEMFNATCLMGEL